MLVSITVAVAVWSCSGVPELDYTDYLLSEVAPHWSLCSHVYIYTVDFLQANHPFNSLSCGLFSVILHALQPVSLASEHHVASCLI